MKCCADEKEEPRDVVVPKSESVDPLAPLDESSNNPERHAELEIFEVFQSHQLGLELNSLSDTKGKSLTRDNDNPNENQVGNPFSRTQTDLDSKAASESTQGFEARSAKWFTIKVVIKISVLLLATQVCLLGIVMWYVTGWCVVGIAVVVLDFHG